MISLCSPGTSLPTRTKHARTRAHTHVHRLPHPPPPPLQTHTTTTTTTTTLQACPFRTHPPSGFLLTGSSQSSYPGYRLGAPPPSAKWQRMFQNAGGHIQRMGGKDLCSCLPVETWRRLPAQDGLYTTMVVGLQSANHSPSITSWCTWPRQQTPTSSVRISAVRQSLNSPRQSMIVWQRTHGCLARRCRHRRLLSPGILLAVRWPVLR
jgi:hypothetical protein